MALVGSKIVMPGREGQVQVLAETDDMGVFSRTISTAQYEKEQMLERLLFITGSSGVGIPSLMHHLITGSASKPYLLKEDASFEILMSE